MQEHDDFHQPDPTERLGGSADELFIVVRDRIWAEQDLRVIYESIRKKAKHSRLSDPDWQKICQLLWDERETQCRLLLENSATRVGLPELFVAYVKEGTLDPKICKELLDLVSNAEAKRLRELIDNGDIHALSQLHQAYLSGLIPRHVRDLLLRVLRQQ